MATCRTVEELTQDTFILGLAEFLDQCSDDLSPAGDGCDRCSCLEECGEFWERIEPKKNNRLSVKELMGYFKEFQRIRGRRQLKMLFTV